MRFAFLLILLFGASASRADDDTPAPSAPARPVAANVVPAPPIVRTDPAAPAEESSPSANAPAPAAFTTEANWATAGYNNEEIVYTIVVHNQDTRILRCNAQIKGSYYEKGKKLPVEDRQLATIFPDQQTPIGNWMGMDQASGASYSVKCRPL